MRFTAAVAPTFQCGRQCREKLPPQFQHRSFVPFLVALPHRPFSFPEPRAELVPLIIGVAEAILLLALMAFHGLAAQSPWNPAFVTSNVTTAPKCADYCSTEIWETA